jgi:hypothetical protein
MLKEYIYIYILLISMLKEFFFFLIKAKGIFLLIVSYAKGIWYHGTFLEHVKILTIVIIE